MSLPSISILRPVTTLMFYIGIALLGVVAFQNLAVDFLPTVKIPKLTIQTSYANTSAEEIENTITQPIESALGTVTGTKKVSSVSKEGLSIITAEFYWGTNMDFAMLDVREKLNQLREVIANQNLPYQNCQPEKPTIFDNGILLINLSRVTRLKMLFYCFAKSIIILMEEPLSYHLTSKVYNSTIYGK